MAAPKKYRMKTAILYPVTLSPFLFKGCLPYVMKISGNIALMKPPAAFIRKSVYRSFESIGPLTALRRSHGKACPTADFFIFDLNG